MIQLTSTMFTLTTWWFVSFSGVEDDGTRIYLLRAPTKNVSVNVRSEVTHNWEENSWVKANIVMECEKIATNSEIIPNIYRNKDEYFCEALKVKELKCTPKNSSAIGKVLYC